MKNLQKIRKDSGFSQSKLAEASGVSVRIIQKYEQGSNDINLANATTLYKLSKVLNCTIEDLLEIN